MIEDIALRDLRGLVAVAEHRHFGRAARACHVTQPALSAQVKRAERALGERVFERSNRQVIITESGHRLVEQARHILAETERLLQMARGDESALTGLFRLGAIATAGPHLLPWLLRPLRREFPDLRLVIREGLTERLLRDLRAGRLDAVLASPPFQDRGLRVRPLYREPFVLALPSDHPLTQDPEITLAKLAEQEMLLLEEGHCLSNQVRRLCPSRADRDSAPPQATSLETLRHMVACGLGPTLLPQLAVRLGEDIEGLVEHRDLGGEGPHRIIALVSRHGHARPQDIEALADFILGHLPKGVEPVGEGSGAD